MLNNMLKYQMCNKPDTYILFTTKTQIIQSQKEDPKNTI
jgi:hypothetical protein